MAPLILNSLTEKDLLRQCLDGDHNAQKQVFEMYAPKMMSVCMRYGRHKLESEEIMQDGFVKVFTNLHKFEYKGSFEGWVRRMKGYRTVFNLSVIDGLSHREISEALGIKESTSRSQLVKARNMLQNMIVEMNKIAM